MAKFLLVLALLIPAAAVAEPLAGPGDSRLRHDLQLLNDSGVTNIPLSTWPVALADVETALDAKDPHSMSFAAKAAYDRISARLLLEMEVETLGFYLAGSASEKARVIRSFENTPREEGEIAAGLTWLDDWFVIKLSATYTANPLDGDEFRPDGTYVGVSLGNWVVTAGWQERWWGPGRDGSMILSTNSRPTPGLAIQRSRSTPFKSKWLSWLGPWTLTSFMTELDDDRAVNDAWLFGLRGSFRPPKTGLEIGISRSAQWCGDSRPCDLEVFTDLLLGNDNRGVNVADPDEPGNQLGGIDVRWALPGGVPLALYMQWIGEDGRGGGGAIGSWMRQVGLEYRGSIGTTSHRTHFELSDSMCREGGFGLGDKKPDCAYEHAIYRTGYRYRDRPIGHAVDGDGLSYSIGSTLVQSAGHSWNISLRYMEINREGAPNPLHTLTPTPQELTDLQITHERYTRYGRFYAGLGFASLDDQASGTSRSDVTGFVQWSSR